MATRRRGKKKRTEETEEAEAKATEAKASTDYTDYRIAQIEEEEEEREMEGGSKRQYFVRAMTRCHGCHALRFSCSCPSFSSVLSSPSSYLCNP
jgi:hypothetical protein